MMIKTTRIEFEKNFTDMLKYYQRHKLDIDRVLQSRFPDDSQTGQENIPYDQKKELLSGFITGVPLLNPSFNNTKAELEPIDEFTWKPRFAAAIKPLIDQQRICGYVLGEDSKPEIGAVAFERANVTDIYKALSQPDLISQRMAGGFKELCFSYIGYVERIGDKSVEAVAKTDVSHDSIERGNDKSSPIQTVTAHAYKVPTLASLVSDDDDAESELYNLECDLVVIPFDKVSVETYINLTLNPRVKRSIDKFKELVPYANETTYPFQSPVFGVRTDEGISIVDGGTRRQFCVMHQTPLHIYVPKQRDIPESILVWMQNHLFDASTPLTLVEKYFQTNALYKNWCEAKKAKGESSSIRGFSCEYRESLTKLSVIFKFCKVVDISILDYIDPKVISDKGLIGTVRELFAFREDNSITDDDKQQLLKDIYANMHERKRQAVIRYEKKNPDSELDPSNIPMDWKKIVPSIKKKFDGEVVKLKNKHSGEVDIDDASIPIPDDRRLKGFITKSSRKNVILRSSETNGVKNLKIKGLSSDQALEIELKILAMLKENNGDQFELSEDLELSRPDIFQRLNTK